LLLLVVFSLPALAHEHPIPTPSIDAAALAIVWPKGTEVPHGANVPKGVIANHGTRTEEVPATLSICDSTGSLVYSSSLTEVIAPFQSQTCSFAKWTAVAGNNYTAHLQTTLAHDQNPANDTLSQAFSVFNGTRDVGVDKIYEPTQKEEDSLFAPSVDVQNYGDLTESFYAYMRITYLGNNTIVYYDSFLVTNIAAHTSQQVTLDTWTGHKVPGSLLAVAWSRLDADQNPGNDTQTFAFVYLPGPHIDGILWLREADVPQGSKGKGVKDGAQLIYTADSGGSVWCLKGNNTNEFYRYDINSGTWQTADSLPLVSRQVGKTKQVKKGSALVAGADGMIYAAKGDGSDEWWQYNPASDSGQPVWTEKAMVPFGRSALKDGADAAAVSINGRNYIYLLKGSGTTEFYRYDCAADSWATMAAAPLVWCNRNALSYSCLCEEAADKAISANYNRDCFATLAMTNLCWHICIVKNR
jgi:hypothetical protein